MVAAGACWRSMIRSGGTGLFVVHNPSETQQRGDKAQNPIATWLLQSEEKRDEDQGSVDEKPPLLRVRDPHAPRRSHIFIYNRFLLFIAVAGDATGWPRAALALHR